MQYVVVQQLQSPLLNLNVTAAYLFADEEVEEDHAEVVDNEGLAELEGLPVLHVFGPQPQKQQVGGADGQRRQGVVHQRPFLHTFVCGTDVLMALRNSSQRSTVPAQCGCSVSLL